MSSNRLKHLAGILSISLSVFLSAIKIIATIYTGSLAILSSLIDSFTDVLASSITFVAIKYSTKPASSEFRYGYGKVEALSSFIQALFITISGVYILIDGIRRFFTPREIDDSALGIFIMIISLCLTIALVIFQKHVIKKTNSLALKGDSAHYIVDIATNISVIVALIIINYTGFLWVDNLIAIGIAIYLLHNAYELAKDSITMLLDQELIGGIREDVENIILKQECTKGVHDLRTRSLGGTYIFEFHLELCPSISLTEAHTQAHQVEEAILAKYPNAQVVIHQEPQGAQEFHLDKQIELNKTKQ